MVQRNGVSRQTEQWRKESGRGAMTESQVDWYTCDVQWTAGRPVYEGQVPSHWQGHRAGLKSQGGVKDLLSFTDQELGHKES